MSRAQRLYQSARQQPLWFYVAVIILLLLLTADFFNRVRVPVAAVGSEAFQSPVLPQANLKESDFMSDSMQQWLASATTAASSDDTTANDAASAAEPALLSNATDLAGILVRVRAVFVQQQGEQVRLALIEQQQTDNRQVDFVTIRPGDELGAYTVHDILSDAVVFKASQQPATDEQAIIRVAVFQCPND